MNEAETKPENDSAAEAPAATTQPEQAEDSTESTPTPEGQLKAAIAERDENHNRWLRAQADLENYRKRAQKDAEETRKYQVLSLMRDFLPGLDNLHRAMAAAEKSQSIDELTQGVQMVAQQFETILANHSLQPIEAVGKPFDPNLHEAVQQVPSNEHPPMTVIEEIERGFTLHDRVVRPCKVIVSCEPTQSNEED